MDQLSEEEIRRTIEVTGLPEDIDLDEVYGLFENVRFGGGKVANLQTKDGVTFITFKDEAVVTSLLSRQAEKKMRVSRNPVELRRYEKPKPVPVIGKTIVVSGIPSTCDHDDILGFFENTRKGGGETESMSSGDTNDVAIISFADQSVAEHFVTLGEVTCGGSKLQVAWPMSDGSRAEDKAEEEVICPRIIIVHNMSEGHMEHLELSLESKRQGGGKVEAMRRNPDGSVTATFVDKNVAARFLERGSVTVSGKAHEITKPSRTVGKGPGKSSAVQDVPNTIEVSGIPETTSEEFLKMYFENKKRSGGGDIKTMTYDKQEGVATITFSDPSAVLKILKKEEHKIGSDVVHVTALESLTSDLIDQACAVRVSNIPQTISKDFLEVYFESGKRSGGEEFEEFLFDKDGACAVVVYKSPEVCRRVTGRSHQLESAQLVVEALKPAPPPPIIVGETDEKKLLVGDLPPDFKDEDLKQFLEKPAGCQINQFHRGPRQDLVLLDFKSIPNYASLRKLVVSRPFKGQMIYVQKVKPSMCVLVHSNKSLSDDLLMLHFENPKRSGGGDVKCIRRGDASSDVIIEFSDRKVIPTVLKKKQVIDNQPLKTELFHECLTGSSGPTSRRQKVRIPEDITVPVEKRVLKFISDSAKIRSSIESDMQTLNCSIQWQKPEEGTIKLCCTLTPGAKNVGKLAAKWEAACSEQIIGHLDKIAVKDEKISAEIWEEYVKKAKSIKTSGVSVEMDQASFLLRLVGLDTAVNEYLKAAAEIRNKLLEELAKRKSKIFESLTSLKPNQLQLLKALKFPSGDPTVSKDLEINIDDHQVSFQGAKDDINQAKIRMYELVNNVSTKMSKVDARKAKFLQKGHAIDYFKELFEKKKLKVFWSIKGQDLEVSGITDKEINEALSLLDSEIQCAIITLDVNQLVLMKQEIWKGFKKGLEDAFKTNDVTEDMHASAVTVVSTRESIEQIENEIRDFLKHHTILEQFIPMEEGKATYMDQFFSQEMDNIQSQLSAEGVFIEVSQKNNSAGILIRGTKSGLEKAVKSLFEIQQPILCTTHESDLYGVLRYFSSHRGKESKEKIENKNKVIVQISKQLKSSGASGANGGVQGTGGVKGPVDKSAVGIHGSVIKVVKGNVVECRVKALGIPIGEDLKHTDGAAKAVVESGGKEIEDECQAHVKTNGKLLTGQIYVSKPGSLGCLHVVHMALPPWQAGTKNEISCLEEGLWATLEKAMQNGWSSVAISCGTNYPPATAAKTIVDTVAEFLDERKSFRIEIRLIDSSDQVVNYLHEMLIKKFGKAAVKIEETEQSNSLIASPVPAGITPDQLSLIQTNYQPGKDTATLLAPEGGIQVALIQGSIAAQQVDVIVNTASKDLNLNQGAVSNSILQAAGANLQTECKTKMPNGLSPGQILITTGCSLQCKNVYHGACEQWDGGKGKAEKVIHDLLKNVFKDAHQNQMTSIAIPALGTGNLGAPREIVSAIMYAEAEEFSKANPTTTLKDIRFVVFDKPTIDVFQQHVNRLCNPSAAVTDKTLKNKQKRTLKQEGAVSAASATQEKTTRLALYETEAAHADISLDIPMKTVKIKSLVMEIKEGDITQENTDAIVNSTNKELNLSGGAVTKAILQAGGHSIAAECKKIGKTDKHGVAVTGAGNLKCKYIIHLATPEKLYLGNAPEGKAWQERIFNCLKEAEHMKLTSVAFPLLGTGIRNTSSGEMAINILNAVGEFACNCKPKHMKNIRITIFQPTMVEEFFTAVQKRLSEKKGTKSMLGKIAGWFSSFVSSDPSGNNDDNDGFEMLEDPATPPLVNYRSIFQVYGLSQTVIDKVLVELENLVKEAVTDKVLDTPDQQEAIAKLTPEQVRQLERDAANHQVKATVEKGRKLNRIRLQGDAKDITDVVFNVVKILKEVEVAELKRNEAERIAQQAHWEFKDSDGSYESYPTDINAIIEQAFKSKVGFAQWEENDGQFKIDFKTNIEENLKNQQKTEVRRIGDAPIEEPKNWDPMNIGEGCKLVQVPVGSNEYDEVETRIKLTCQKSCKEIMKIERVQNHSLYQQYAVNKLHMEASAGAGATTERILWHGTSEATVPQINVHGFNRSYCGKNATAFGKGVYFARDWTYSAHPTYSPPNTQGFKFIYQARVLAGEFILGNPEYFDAPLKPNETTKRYDSVVNDVQNPSIFVVFRDTQVYPEYLITFI